MVSAADKLRDGRPAPDTPRVGAGRVRAAGLRGATTRPAGRPAVCSARRPGLSGRVALIALEGREVHRSSVSGSLDHPRVAAGAALPAHPVGMPNNPRRWPDVSARTLEASALVLSLRRHARCPAVTAAGRDCQSLLTTACLKGSRGEPHPPRLTGSLGRCHSSESGRERDAGSTLGLAVVAQLVQQRRPVCRAGAPITI